MHVYNYTALIFENGSMFKYSSAAYLPIAPPIGLNHCNELRNIVVKNVGLNPSQVVIGDVEYTGFENVLEIAQ